MKSVLSKRAVFLLDKTIRLWDVAKNRYRKVLHGPLAARGLVIIMIGATVVTLASGAVVSALVPLMVGLLCTAVAYGRRSWAQVYQFGIGDMWEGRRQLYGRICL